MVLNMLVNMVATLELNVVAIAPSATATMPARTAYSMALTPRSSRTKNLMNLVMSIPLNSMVSVSAENGMSLWLTDRTQGCEFQKSRQRAVNALVRPFVGSALPG